jgi:hypothetical protein
MKKFLGLLSNAFVGAFFWDPLYYFYIPAGLLGIGLKLFGTRYHHPTLFTTTAHVKLKLSGGSCR